MYTFSTILIFVVLINNVMTSSEKAPNVFESLSRADISVPPMQPPNQATHCIKFQCKIICINGKLDNVQGDILTVQDPYCQIIDELHLIGYVSPNGIIPKNFLGNISNSVKNLSIYASNVVHIESGAFQSTVLSTLHLENLKLYNIHKGIFEDVSEKFTHFTLIQKGIPLENVNDNLLGHIKYQIKSIKIQTGLLTVENLTKSDCLLNNLEDVNLSFNNFGRNLTASSFVKLSVVEKLNLSHSEISFLPEFIFSDIIGTLRVLDLTSNKLKFIARNVFGWHELGKSLVIYVKDNPWDCSCELQNEMIYILAYQHELVYCEQPHNILVTDEQLCSESCSKSSSEKCIGNMGEKTTPVPSPPFMPTSGSAEATKSTSVRTTTESEEVLTTDSSGLATLECRDNRSSLEIVKFPILWPNFHFEIRTMEDFKVEIEFTGSSVSLNGSYGILWFSNVTTQYNNMEVNYNDFGLGCLGVRQYVTTVENLIPDVSYTFCLVLKDKQTVSPFSCKSVYIDGNLSVKYNAWLTTNMRATGITLIILGIVLFKFLGVLSVFLLLRNKPTLVKGSKRVHTPKNDSMNIIVFPRDKTLQNFKMMEKQIAQRNSKGLEIRRLSSGSIKSVDSNQSYMNPISTNLYEVIPAYQRYLSTCSLETDVDTNYSDTPFKKKRTSNDPLPAIPDSSKISTPVLNLRLQDTCTEYSFIPEVYNV